MQTQSSYEDKSEIQPKSYYEENGYIVFRNLIPWDISDADETVNCDCVYFGKVFEVI